MEAQNHFYGHSAAWAAYLGRRSPRHLPGLAQHGWTAVSPVATHFRDFPRAGTPGSHQRLLVWSHRSRGWNPAEERHDTTPIGAQLLYLALAAGPPPVPRDHREAVVLMPVHGIQTQRVRGDHGALARDWRDAEGPATACLYASDAQDPDILHAYLDAGHRVVVLGHRLDADFLWRLWTLLGRAHRVVSNRLSTPVFYAAHLGADIGVYGDSLRIDGESREQNDRVRELWPELHERHVDPASARRIAADELGAAHVLDRAELERALGWDGSTAVPALQYWTTSVAQRAVVNLRRKAAAPGPPQESTPAQEGLSFAAWLRAATTYLPKPLPRGITPAGTPVEPIAVGAADRGSVPG